MQKLKATWRDMVKYKELYVLMLAAFLAGVAVSALAQWLGRT